MTQKLKLFCSLLLISILWVNGFSETRDTVLNTVYSKPFFYNVLKNKDGKIIVGTAEGVFRIEDNKLIAVNETPGYVTVDNKGNIAINPEGIRNYKERKYAYLLPYPEFAQDEYHAGTEEQFYVCSGGRIYIFDIVPYVYSYPNHSIRTISEHFVGTYSGIYFNGVRLNDPIVPDFTDGIIREIQNQAFICYDGLVTIEAQSSIFDNTPDTIFRNIKGSSTIGVQFRDVIRSIKNNKYYYATVNQLLVGDSTNAEPKSIYSSKDKFGDISILGEVRGGLFFSDSHQIIEHKIINGSFSVFTRLKDPILDGSVTNRHVYALTNDGLYVINTDKTSEKLVQLSRAHTMEMLSETSIIISTDNGLFLFNTVNKTLLPIIRGVEFNRRALFLKDNMLSAGSINGLYTINVNDLELLAQRNLAKLQPESKSVSMIVGLVLAALIILVLSILLFRVRKQLVAAQEHVEEEKDEPLSKERIEQFIEENLANASLKSIIDHFKSNNSQIYRLIEPEKPGSIIQKKRVEKMIALRNEGKSLQEIAEVTGLSESYLKKIKNKAE